MSAPGHRFGAGIVLSVIALLLATLGRSWLEATMQRHMLLHVPLLFFAGVAWAHDSRRRAQSAWNAHGVAGLLFATGVLMTWMVPRALDAAVEQPLVDVSKAALLFAAGALGHLSWRRASVLVQSFVLGNGAWMTASIGLMLVDSPERLCANYGAGDQRSSGVALITVTIGVMLLFALRHVYPSALRRSVPSAQS